MLNPSRILVDILKQGLGKILKLKFGQYFAADVWLKLNLGQYSEARFGQDFIFRFSRYADVWHRGDEGVAAGFQVKGHY